MPEEKIDVSTGINITDVKGVCDTCTTSCCNEAFGLLRDKFDMMTVNINNQTENIPALNSFNYIPSDNTYLELVGRSHYLDIAAEPDDSCEPQPLAVDPVQGGEIYTSESYVLWGFREEYSFKIFCGDEIEVEVVETLPDAGVRPEDTYITLPDSIEGAGSGNEQSRFALYLNMTHIMIKGVDSSPRYIPQELVNSSNNVKFSPDDDKARRSLHPHNQAKSANWSYPEPVTFTNQKTGYKVVMIRKIVPVPIGNVSKKVIWDYSPNTCPRQYLTEQEIEFGAVDWCREADIWNERMSRPFEELVKNGWLGGDSYAREAEKNCKAQSGDNSWRRVAAMRWTVSVNHDLNNQNTFQSGYLYSNDYRTVTFDTVADAVQNVIQRQKERGALDKVISPDFSVGDDQFAIDPSTYDPNRPTFETIDENNLMQNLDFAEQLRPECFSGMTYSPTGLKSVSDRCSLRLNNRITRNPKVLNRVVGTVNPYAGLSNQSAITDWYPSDVNKFRDWFFIEIYDPITDKAEEIRFTPAPGVANQWDWYNPPWLDWSNITIYEVENTDEAATSLDLPLSLKEIISVENKHAQLTSTPTNGSASGGAIPTTARDAAFRWASWSRMYAGPETYRSSLAAYGTWRGATGHFDSGLDHSQWYEDYLVGGPPAVRYGPDYFDSDGKWAPNARAFSGTHIFSDYTVRSPAIIKGGLREIWNTLSFVTRAVGAFGAFVQSGPWRDSFGALPSYNYRWTLESVPSVSLDKALGYFALTSEKLKFFLEPPAREICDRYADEQERQRLDPTNQVGEYIKLYLGDYRAEGGSGWPAGGLKTADATWEMRETIAWRGPDRNGNWRDSGGPDRNFGDGYLWYDSAFGGTADPSVPHSVRTGFQEPRDVSYNRDKCELRAYPQNKRTDAHLVELTETVDRFSGNYTSTLGIELR
jgi:hypothetical protein